MNAQGTVSIRFRPDERALIEEAAAATHCTVGEYMRAAAGREALLSRPGAVLRRSTAGAPIVLWTNIPGLVTA